MKGKTSVSVSKRFVILLAAGLPVLIASLFINFYTVVFLLYNLICFCLLAADYFISPAPSAFVVSREQNNKLYYKTPNTITFMIRNNFYRPCRIGLKDDIPDWHFKITGGHMNGTVNPSGESAFYYNIIPSKRGNFLFERVHVRYDGVIGLCQRYFICDAPMDYKVYPNLTDIGKYRLIIQKNRLLTHGEKRIRLRGAGTEFESLREYVEGDDYRKINWLVSARENKLIANQYEAEKNQPVFILIDTGRPMSYTIKGYKKLDYAINAALILSDIVNQKGDNSGLVVFDTDVKSVIMPGKGEAHRNNLMETLYHVSDTKNTSDYAGAFMEVTARQKRRSLVFLFTDFETRDEAEDIMKNITILKKRHIPVVVLIKNESLHAMAKDADTMRAAYRKAVAVDFIDERDKLIKALNSIGVLCVESPAESFALTAVNRYLEIKNRNLI